MSNRINANEIVSVLTEEINKYRDKIEPKEVGEVLEVGDGIARVYGLSGVMAGEMVEFAAHQACAAWPSTSKRTRSASSFSATTKTSPRATRSAPPAACCSVPVGDALIGRVVDPLGNPLDGKGPDRHVATRASSNRRRPAWPAGSRWTCRCKPASRPSTP